VIDAFELQTVPSNVALLPQRSIHVIRMQVQHLGSKGAHMKRFVELSVLGFAFSITLLAGSSANLIAPPNFAWQEPENHAIEVERLMRYHDFGEYDREIRDVTNAARDYVETVASHNPQREKLAVVFDIDETALSNWDAMAACGFCSYSAQQELYSKAHDPVYSNEHDPAIMPTLELFNRAKNLGMTVFFVTGRPESQRNLTEQNLTAVGYSDWKELRMCNPAVDPECGKIPPPPASLIKPRSRKRIEDEGYRIILSIGDQASDLAGCCAERVFKLPNPFYLLR
jgi:predicted secreted acid phosphatase